MKLLYLNMGVKIGGSLRGKGNMNNKTANYERLQERTFLWVHSLYDTHTYTHS
jgi:hypothetical protein